ncbi:VanZ family protein [Streptomyces sp. NPDC057682]|uniref:VanZ family protein n=1 Tax=unclassified Streptomyces TaxID=2593676 RepID=UPI0036508C2E
MNDTLSPSAPPGRTHRTVLLVLAVLGTAAAALVLRGPLMMVAPRCLSGNGYACYGTFNGVVLLTLLALPLSVLLVWALAHRRRRAGRAAPWRTSVAEVAMVHGTVPFVWMTMMPGSAPGVAPARVSLVPLRDLVTMGPFGVIGNLLVLAAVGAFAPVRYAAVATLPRVLALGAGCSALIETAQYVFRLDRVSSVDDILVNATGAALAGLVSRPWWAARPTAPVRTSPYIPDAA